MSVLIEFSLFPLDRGESLSAEVAQIVELIRQSGYDYKLTAMGTIVETPEVNQALTLVEQSYSILEKNGCNRVYASIKMDIRKGRNGRLAQKIQSIEDRIGEVNQ
ncbi:MAG: MTH1187 family thiamine-binding protein [Gammaproteobacteria bacterium]|nr:MTH1187 family thiamine-binding protein [Gammaproteobacteria bacterium]